MKLLHITLLSAIVPCALWTYRQPSVQTALYPPPPGYPVVGAELATEVDPSINLWDLPVGAVTWVTDCTIYQDSKGKYWYYADSDHNRYQPNEIMAMCVRLVRDKAGFSANNCDPMYRSRHTSMSKEDRLAADEREGIHTDPRAWIPLVSYTSNNIERY